MIILLLLRLSVEAEFCACGADGIIVTRDREKLVEIMLVKRNGPVPTACQSCSQL